MTCPLWIGCCDYSSGKRIFLKLDAPKQVELSGPGGGPIKTDGSLNLSALSNEELQMFLVMMEKMKDTEGGDGD